MNFVQPQERRSTSLPPPELRARSIDGDGYVPLRAQNVLTGSEQNALLGIGAPQDCPHTGTRIFSEGCRAQFVFAVAQGVVRISRHRENGQRQVLAFMMPGDVF